MLKFKRDDWSNQSRFKGLATSLAPCLAIVLCLVSAGVVAQTTFDFEDPIDDIRSQIETTTAQSDPVRVPDNTSDSPRDPEAGTPGTTGAAADVQAGDAPLADRFGMSKNGLLGLLGVGLLALGSLIAWLLFRKRKSAPGNPEGTVYAQGGVRKRRVLDSGAHVVRRKTSPLDTSETPEQAAEAEAARLAASEAEAEAQESAGDEPSQAIVADDPDTWRRPNLERLKASIRDDWKGGESNGADRKPAFESDEAQAYAELFGGDEPEPRESEQTSTVLDMLDTYSSGQEPEQVDHLQEAGKSPVDTSEATRRARPPLPSRSEALRRVQALRDSVKAG